MTFTKNKNKNTNSGKLGFSLNKLLFQHLVLKKIIMGYLSILPNT
jgi:hypothetical protein